MLEKRESGAGPKQTVPLAQVMPSPASLHGRQQVCAPAGRRRGHPRPARGCAAGRAARTPRAPHPSPLAAGTAWWRRPSCHGRRTPRPASQAPYWTRSMGATEQSDGAQQYRAAALHVHALLAKKCTVTDITVESCQPNLSEPCNEIRLPRRPPGAHEDRSLLRLKHLRDNRIGSQRHNRCGVLNCLDLAHQLDTRCLDALAQRLEVAKGPAHAGPLLRKNRAGES